MDAYSVFSFYLYIGSLRKLWGSGAGRVNQRNLLNYLMLALHHISGLHRLCRRLCPAGLPARPMPAPKRHQFIGVLTAPGGVR